MPAFTFEKISSPVRSTTRPVAIDDHSASSSRKQTPDQTPRGIVVRLLDRFAGGRLTRHDRGDAATRGKHPSD